MIPFNKPLITGEEEKYLCEAINNHHLSGDGNFTRKCEDILENFTGSKVLLTTSCTSALEMASLIIDIKPGDEVIVPSYTFVSTANAFVTHGARIVFVDIEKETMNVNPANIENAITSKTKAIVPVHYAGVGCDMDKIMFIAEKYNLYVIEDAAQGFPSTYKDKALGSIGHLGCYSFHETKNYSMGEGGAIIVNDKTLIDKAQIVWQKGTNRQQFREGLVDRYTWVDKGSSYLPSELNAAYLYPGLLNHEMINDNRKKAWDRYYFGLRKLNEDGLIELPNIPNACKHNAHMFYIKVRDLNERRKLIKYLAENEIVATFHYVPLHDSPAGEIFSTFHGKDKFTTSESERLLRLPMYYNISEDDIDYVIMKLTVFFN